MSLMLNYCGAGLLCCRSLEDSTYNHVRLALYLACALHIGFLMTLNRRLR
jgi:hypothetical protein